MHTDILVIMLHEYHAIYLMACVSADGTFPSSMPIKVSIDCCMMISYVLKNVQSQDNELSF